MFSVEERCAMIRRVCLRSKAAKCDLKVDSFSGLTADFARTERRDGDRARHSRRFRLRIRIADGADESTARTRNRNRFFDGGGRIFVCFVESDKTGFHARRARRRFRSAALVEAKMREKKTRAAKRSNTKYFSMVLFVLFI